MSFFFNDTATTEIYTLSLHDALPISIHADAARADQRLGFAARRHARARQGALQAHRRHSGSEGAGGRRDRKSTRLNSSHGYISYAVFCLKKKKTEQSEQFHAYDERLI